MISVQELITKAQRVINDDDPPFARWKQPEMIGWVNDAAKATVIMLPTARAIMDTLTLVAGAKQALSDRSVFLFDVIRNISAAGAAGRAIRVADRQLLDDQDPNWQSQKLKKAVWHYTFDERSPRTFFVYPPVEAGTKVEASFAQIPPEVAALGDNVDLPAQFIEALVSYIVFRAYSKDSLYSQQSIAAAHYQAFAGSLGIDVKSEAATSPNGVSQ